MKERPAEPGGEGTANMSYADNPRPVRKQSEDTIERVDRATCPHTYSLGLGHRFCRRCGRPISPEAK